MGVYSTPRHSIGLPVFHYNHFSTLYLLRWLCLFSVTKAILLTIITSKANCSSPVLLETTLGSPCTGQRKFMNYLSKCLCHSVTLHCLLLELKTCMYRFYVWFSMAASSIQSSFFGPKLVPGCSCRHQSGLSFSWTEKTLISQVSEKLVLPPPWSVSSILSGMNFSFLFQGVEF